MREELKSCPFCGGEAFERDTIVDGINVHHVTCKYCAADVRAPEPNPAYAVTLWNSRFLELENILEELEIAEAKAWDSLSRYKFQMFGYWAAIWIHLNRISGKNRPNPWRELVMRAREEKV